MIDKALAFIFWLGAAALGTFIIAFVFLVFYLITTLGILSVVYLLQ